MIAAQLRRVASREEQRDEHAEVVAFLLTATREAIAFEEAMIRWALERPAANTPPYEVVRQGSGW